MDKPPRPRRNCPHADCKSHAPGGRSPVIRHSRLKTKQGLRRRLLCKGCGRTFVHTLGTPYYRMRKPHRLFDQAAALQVEGLPQASIARALRRSPCTVSSWLEKASQRVREFEAEHLHLDEPVEIQIVELKAYGAGDRDRTWLFSGIEVWSRLWLASEVGPRTLRCTRILVRALCDACVPLLRHPLRPSPHEVLHPPLLPLGAEQPSRDHVREGPFGMKPVTAPFSSSRTEADTPIRMLPM